MIVYLEEDANGDRRFYDEGDDCILAIYIDCKRTIVIRNNQRIHSFRNSKNTQIYIQGEFSVEKEFSENPETRYNSMCVIFENSEGQKECYGTNTYDKFLSETIYRNSISAVIIERKLVTLYNGPRLVAEKTLEKTDEVDVCIRDVILKSEEQYGN